ncbi:splicing regulator SDE2 [Pelobates fuscus]|uniref:splicing regulator SDE2 n=1 Tax=Pelobates fuscus TaxID=191477 RepID=UPI002FE45231
MAAAVWVRDALSGRVSGARRPQGATVRDLLPQPDLGLTNDFYVKCNGRLVDLEEELQDGLTYSVELRLCGGKGGFGSMLRALGAQIEKTTNREACRDLSGRRLRDVNHEKAMAEWIKKQAEREAEKEQRRLERLQRKLAEPKHYFTDPEYHRQCHDMSERLEDSVIKGLQASSSTVVSPETEQSRKRKTEVKVGKSESGKKKCFWTGVEGLEVSSSSDSDSDCESPSTSSASHSTDPKLHSSESQSDSDGSESHPTPMTTSQTTKEQKMSVEASEEQKMSVEASEEQKMSVEASEEQKMSVEASEEQKKSVEASEEQKKSVEASEEQKKSVEASEEQKKSVEASEEEKKSVEASEEQKKYVEASEEQKKSVEASEEQKKSVEASEEQKMSVEASEEQKMSVEASEEQKMSVEASEEQKMSVEASEEQKMSVEASEEQKKSEPTIQQICLSEERLPDIETAKPAPDTVNKDSSPLDLLKFNSAVELEVLGLEKLKVELAALGLKCGGTLQERAARLYSVRGLSRDQIDPSLFAKPAKGKRK